MGECLPKLRFHDFNGNWTEKNVFDIADTIDGDRSARYPSETDLVDDGIIFLSTSNIIDNKLSFKERRFITEKKFKELTKGHLEQDDLIVTLRGSIGNIIPFRNETYKKGFINAQMMIIRLKNCAPTNFFHKWYLTPRTQKTLLRLSSGSAQPQLTKSDIKNLKIRLPSKSEQEKIASFFEKVDEKIDKLEKKLYLWKIYKKGLIQQLLNQELRFKDEHGNDYPEWKRKKFNEIFDFISTNSLSRADLNDESGKVINIHYGDIHKKFPHILDFDIVNVPFINENVNLDNIKDENYCKDGDLVIVDASEDYEDIGKAVELKNINGKMVLAGLHTILARDNGGFTIGGFRNYILLEKSVKLQLKKLATGVSVLGISKSNLGKIDLKIPSIPEQLKIASFLSSIYTKIELINKELEINKEFKNGLLQQMFPD